MEVPPPQLPALPDRLNGLNLLQYVAATASENRDAAIQNQMNPQFLFALGIAAWIKCEIHIRIMLQPNPNAILVSYSTPLTALSLKVRLVQHCGISQRYSLGAHRASVLHSCGRDSAERNLFGPSKCQMSNIYPSINRLSTQDAVFGLLTYWGLVGVQENDEDARLYDWLTQVIEWEIFQQVNDLFATI